MTVLTVGVAVSACAPAAGSKTAAQLVPEVRAAASGCLFSPATQGGASVLQCRQGGDTLDLAADGPPYLVYWSGPHGQHLAFSDWNSVVLPAAPPPSQVVSLSSPG